jgi:hypothetical protein
MSSTLFEIVPSVRAEEFYEYRMTNDVEPEHNKVALAAVQCFDSGEYERR